VVRAGPRDDPGEDLPEELVEELEEAPEEQLEEELDDLGDPEGVDREMDGYAWDDGTSLCVSGTCGSPFEDCLWG